MLDAKKVFIDTQYFKSKAYNFDFADIKAFKGLCFYNHIEHVMTTVVEGEIFSHIDEDTNNAIKAFEKIVNDVKRKNLPCVIGAVGGDVTTFNKEQFSTDACAAFNKFKDETKVRIVDASGVDTEELLGSYFKGTPPFATGKKKDEFPDAISMLSLRSVLEEGEKIYIVSGDGDLEKFRDKYQDFIYFKTLSEFLDHYNERMNSYYSQLVKSYVAEHEGELKVNILGYLNELYLQNDAPWEDSEVVEFNFRDVEHLEPQIISVSEEDAQVAFNVFVTLDVTVEGPDYVNGLYDKEDGRVYTFGTTTRVEEIYEEISVELVISYEEKDRTLDVSHEDFEFPDIKDSYYAVYVDEIEDAY